MKLEDIKAAVTTNCPDMLDHEDFMFCLEALYCEEGSGMEEYTKRVKGMSREEFDAYEKLCEKLNTATVGQVIEYLKSSFKPDDRLCYMDCVEGYKNDCTYVAKDQLGERFFYYVKDLKRKAMERCGSTKCQEDDIYPYVDDNDVIVC